MKQISTRIIAGAFAAGLATTAMAVDVTGDPSSDAGWTFAGHSLENGVYVKGSANYGFNVYSAGLLIEAGSNLEIAMAITPGWLGTR